MIIKLWVIGLTLVIACQTAEGQPQRPNRSDNAQAVCSAHGDLKKTGLDEAVLECDTSLLSGLIIGNSMNELARTLSKHFGEGSNVENTPIARLYVDPTSLGYEGNALRITPATRIQVFGENRFSFQRSDYPDLWDKGCRILLEQTAYPLDVAQSLETIFEKDQATLNQLMEYFRQLEIVKLPRVRLADSKCNCEGKEACYSAPVLVLLASEVLDGPGAPPQAANFASFSAVSLLREKKQELEKNAATVFDQLGQEEKGKHDICFSESRILLETRDRDHQPQLKQWEDFWTQLTKLKAKAIENEMPEREELRKIQSRDGTKADVAPGVTKKSEGPKLSPAKTRAKK